MKNPASEHRYALNAGRIWKGDILVADIEELEQMDASEIHVRRLDAKVVLTTYEKCKKSIPSRRWNSENLWRRSTSENIHVNPGLSGTRRGTGYSLRRIRRTLFSIPTSR